MPNTTADRDSARDALRIANDLMLDLINAARAYETFQLLFGIRAPGEPVDVGVNRLCLFYTCLTLSKWLEWHERYGRFIPDHALAEAKSLRAELQSRGLREFRNKYVGHIWDKDRKRPLTVADVDARVEAIAGPDIPAFFRWV